MDQRILVSIPKYTCKMGKQNCQHFESSGIRTKALSMDDSCVILSDHATTQRPYYLAL